MDTSEDIGQRDAERSMSDLRTVRSPWVAAPNEVSIGNLRTAQTKSRRITTAESEGDIIAGRYRITRRLGHGGMGVVYLAVDQKLGREVCVKRLLPSQDSANHGIDLFLQEARAIAALNHRNIVTVHELGEDERGPFIVMEYLDGTTLKYRIEGRPLSVEQLVDFGAQIADALEAAHLHGVRVDLGDEVGRPAALARELRQGLAVVSADHRGTRGSDSHRRQKERQHQEIHRRAPSEKWTERVVENDEDEEAD